MTSTVEAVTSRTNRYLTHQQRSAIAAAVASGTPQTQVAQDFGITRMTVSRIMREVRNATTEKLGDWRQSQTSKAIKAVDAGLDAEDDPYKRATIGVTVLKGLGVYQGDGATNVAVNVFANVQDLPRDWYAKLEFVEESDQPAQDVVVDTIVPLSARDTDDTTR